jgi:hypothetical protein
MEHKEKSGLTKRSKKLNQADLQEKLAGSLTQTTRYACPQYNADMRDTFLRQTRSLKGYSFLTGVAYCATNGWIILIGDHGAARDYDKCASPLLCTACMSAIRSILPLRPGFFPERGCLHSPEVQRTVGTAAFGGVRHFRASFYTRTESCSQTFSQPAHPQVTQTVRRH